MRLLNSERFEIEGYRCVGWYGGKLFAQHHKLAAFLERFAIARTFHFAGALQSFFGAAKLLDQLPCSNLADSGFAALACGGPVIGVARTWNVVDRIAH